MRALTRSSVVYRLAPFVRRAHVWLCRRVEVECFVSARCLNVDKPRRAANNRLIRLRLQADGLDVAGTRLCSYGLVLWAHHT